MYFVRRFLYLTGESANKSELWEAYGKLPWKSWEPAQLLLLDWQDDSAGNWPSAARESPVLRNKAKYLNV